MVDVSLGTQEGSEVSPPQTTPARPRTERVGYGRGVGEPLETHSEWRTAHCPVTVHHDVPGSIGVEEGPKGCLKDSVFRRGCPIRRPSLHVGGLCLLTLN